MTDDELHTLAGPYALDGLGEAETQAFEAHLAHCETCSIAVVEFGLTAAELTEIAPVAPPEALKSRLLTQIANTPQVDPAPAEVDELARRRRPPARVLAMVAAASFVVVGAIAAFGLIERESPTDQLIAAPDAVTIELDATVDEYADASIEVVWSQDQDRALIIASGLEDPGEGKTYELWFLHDDGMEPAGLFVPIDGEMSTVMDLGLPDVPGRGWGISIEPAEGSDQPTTDPVFVGMA